MKRTDMHWDFQLGEFIESGMFRVFYDLDADITRLDLFATYINGGEL